MDRIFIDISGYGYTGKTAISDFLKSSKKIKSFPNTFEFELFRVQNGLFDLYLSNQHTWSLIRSTNKLKNFQKLIYRIGNVRNPLKIQTYFNSGHSYQNIFKDKFISISNEFIEEIIESSEKVFWPYENLTNSNSDLLINKLKYILFKKVAYSNIHYSKRENIKSLINDYLQKLFDVVCNKNQDFILLNNFFEPYDTDICLEIINNSKSIVVDRDPRDIYSSLINTNEVHLPDFENKKTIEFLKSTSNFHNINSFINRYKLLRMNTKEGNHKSGLRLRFEDFILDNEKKSKEICQFLNLKDVEPLSKDSLENSKKNIGIWKKYQNSPEIKLIEKELAEYCYQK
tara:strand:+ start:574 stop:1602 length:1029 start_codon:yes stop_codon:yes gene_type:complete